MTAQQAMEQGVPLIDVKESEEEALSSAKEEVRRMADLVRAKAEDDKASESDTSSGRGKKRGRPILRVKMPSLLGKREREAREKEEEDAEGDSTSSDESGSSRYSEYRGQRAATGSGTAEGSPVDGAGGGGGSVSAGGTGVLKRSERLKKKMESGLNSPMSGLNSPMSV